IAFAIAGGMLVGATMSGNNQSDGDVSKGALKFGEVLTYINRDYVDTVDIHYLVETGIKNMLGELDPHSVYISAEDKALANSQLEGGFEGIGIEFNIIKDTIYVVSPLSGGPSEKVGLHSGDKIIKVDDEDVAGIGITNKDVFDKLRGKKGTKVKVTIKRRNVKEPMDFTITRGKIPQTSVDVAYMVKNGIGYIKVSRFAATTYDEFKAAMKKLLKQGMDKLIIDLQGNPGGYMDRAINMVDEMLPDNDLIVYTKGRQSKFNSTATAHRKGSFETEPVIVLINEGSASASEIVSGALQDNDRALIVGRRSFGKGLVQMPIDLSDGSEMRLTISRYYTPSGRSIQKPYQNGHDKSYDLDLLERYEHGEFFHADSIQFNDSLKYETSKGRTVYGGGGIMPDYYVPFDTTYNTNYLSQLFAQNVIREYTLNYYEDHKAKFNSMEYEDFKQNFQISDQMLAEVIRMGEKSGVELNQEEFDRSKKYLKIYIKALLARGEWGDDGFFPIFNETNEIFQQSLKLFDQAEALLTM
ncbi:S41 family peptidase, partial [Xanthovirga aplysinae]|uniref:S41 family peptidase n=1 Tax=Xanthovirga aplysinae TaxID=2529853 RepID=UPI001FE897C8